MILTGPSVMVGVWISGRSATSPSTAGPPGVAVTTGTRNPPSATVAAVNCAVTTTGITGGATTTGAMGAAVLAESATGAFGASEIGGGGANTCVGVASRTMVRGGSTTVGGAAGGATTTGGAAGVTVGDGGGGGVTVTGLAATVTLKVRVTVAVPSPTWMVKVSVPE